MKIGLIPDQDAINENRNTEQIIRFRPVHNINDGKISGKVSYLA